jgi:hypothetical protein
MKKKRKNEKNTTTHKSRANMKFKNSNGLLMCDNTCIKILIVLKLLFKLLVFVEVVKTCINLNMKPADEYIRFVMQYICGSKMNWCCDL